MKLNEQVAILTSRICLVPYSAHHVPTYHEWMQDTSLQQATASEPLTLAQEYSMQKSWREDADKLTFIACLPPDGLLRNDDGRLELAGGKADVDGDQKMVGDVNLFIFESEEDGECDLCVGEVEIMVARKDMHGQGIGTTILRTFLWYLFVHLDEIISEYSKSSRSTKRAMKYLRVKIDAGNDKSIKLFEKAGFRKMSESPNFFNELELRYNVPSIRASQKIAQNLGIDEPKVALYHLSSS
ncbi:uncharacterized protein PV09_05417 [Verruconis gallopava]|uniref:N-acetyltransferase domain-containing protein n=1 Tax=Verruconis gallopava TaxID=253628 RepID=A0A0D1XLA3_9PEZI|nr:uncharacterized protein PV09_05417 [Verruconis gallopava]KIW03191.1 hypothetical protein PV09_05417 [Verruconis gallopava]